MDVALDTAARVLHRSVFFYCARQERIGLANVARIFGTALADILLEKRHAGYFQKQRRHEQRARERPPRSGPERGQSEAPPHATLSEVVGVPRVSPEARVEHAPAVAGVFPETF